MVQYIKIGQIINTHGHKGEVKIYPLTDDNNRFLELPHVFIRKKEQFQEYGVNKARIHRNLVILELEGINDMNEAEALKGYYLELPQEELIKLPAGHYYIFQLIGLDVYEKDLFLGKLTQVLQTGSNDVYVVQKEDGKEILLPALKNVIIKIDLEVGIMEVEIPPGLME